MLIHDARWYIEEIVKELREANRFILAKGKTNRHKFPLVNGAFVEWEGGIGKLRNTNGLWSVDTVEGNDALEGQILTPQYPYFQAGHPIELNEVLEDLSKTKGKKKYPLIYLQEDVAEKTNNDNTVLFENASIYILTWTKKNYRSKDRMEKVFEPLLIPLFNLFLETMSKMGIPYEITKKINRKYWGRQDEYGNKKNVLDDPIDGIDSEINITIEENIFCN